MTSGWGRPRGPWRGGRDGGLRPRGAEEGAVLGDGTDSPAAVDRPSRWPEGAEVSGDTREQARVPRRPTLCPCGFSVRASGASVRV